MNALTNLPVAFADDFAGEQEAPLSCRVPIKLAHFTPETVAADQAVEQMRHVADVVADLSQHALKYGYQIHPATYYNGAVKMVMMPMRQHLHRVKGRPIASDPDVILKIQTVVAEFYKISMDDMKAAYRPERVARPRQIAMYLTRELTKLPFDAIGSAFGGRDHGTVIHACKAVCAMMDTNPRIKDEIESLTLEIISS